jgi:hypothetical protein
MSSHQTLLTKKNQLFVLAEGKGIYNKAKGTRQGAIMVGGNSR